MQTYCFLYLHSLLLDTLRLARLRSEKEFAPQLDRGVVRHQAQTQHLSRDNLGMMIFSRS